MTPEALLRFGLSAGAKVLDLKIHVVFQADQREAKATYLKLSPSPADPPRRVSPDCGGRPSEGRHVTIFGFGWSHCAPGASRDGSHPALCHALSPRIARRAGFRGVEKQRTRPGQSACDRISGIICGSSAAAIAAHKLGRRRAGLRSIRNRTITAPGAVYRIALSSRFATARHRFFEAD